MFKHKVMKSKRNQMVISLFEKAQGGTAKKSREEHKSEGNVFIVVRWVTGREINDIIWLL